VKPAVLAYSGGLDTSVTVRWLTDQGYDVHAVVADIGQREDWDKVRERGDAAGAKDVRVVRAVDRFAAEFLAPAIRANALYEGRYPLVSSLARPLIAQEIVTVAREVGAGVVAHGCTGKGNDQVRFEVSFGVLAPDLEVLAPVRDPGIPREKAVSLAAEWGIPIPAVANSYSIDDNLWGRACECGDLEDPWFRPPEDAFARTASPAERRSDQTDVVVGFEAPIPVSLDEERLPLAELIARLDALAGGYGFGRIDMIENRRVGIKSREVYEAPAALALITAHRALEDLTIEREVGRFKPGVERRWAELVYDGMWFSPLREALDAFVDATQRSVSGDVRLSLSAGSCGVTGRRSDGSLYDAGLATYGAGDLFDQRHAEGFIKLWGLPLEVWSRQQGPGRGRA